MGRLRHLVAAVAVAATVTCALAITSGATAGPTAGANELLPDLDQQTPTGLVVGNAGTRARPLYVLGFQSAVRNIGAGPLIINGMRTSRKTPTMHAYQQVELGDGGHTTTEVAGRLRYAIALTHQHWHFLHFDRYELRRAGHAAAVVRDQKTGFCLGDRYKVAGYSVSAAKPAPTYIGGCGLREPWLLHVEEGISPGYGDNYLPYFEGQSLPLTGLPAGHYVLVHRANPDRSLRESNYSNDAASVLLNLRWHGPRPNVDMLATCPDTDACDTVMQAASAASISVWNRTVPEGMVAAPAPPR
jgi:Lysyl oxidase